MRRLGAILALLVALLLLTGGVDPGKVGPVGSLDPGGYTPFPVGSQGVAGGQPVPETFQFPTGYQPAVIALGTMFPGAKSWAQWAKYDVIICDISCLTGGNDYQAESVFATETWSFIDSLRYYNPECVVLGFDRTIMATASGIGWKWIEEERFAQACNAPGLVVDGTQSTTYRPYPATDGQNWYLADLTVAAVMDSMIDIFERRWEQGNTLGDGIPGPAYGKKGVGVLMDVWNFNSSIGLYTNPNTTEDPPDSVDWDKDGLCLANDLDEQELLRGLRFEYMDSLRSRLGSDFLIGVNSTQALMDTAYTRRADVIMVEDFRRHTDPRTPSGDGYGGKWYYAGTGGEAGVPWLNIFRDDYTPATDSQYWKMSAYETQTGNIEDRADDMHGPKLLYFENAIFPWQNEILDLMSDHIVGHFGRTDTTAYQAGEARRWNWPPSTGLDDLNDLGYPTGTLTWDADTSTAVRTYHQGAVYFEYAHYDSSGPDSVAFSYHVAYGTTDTTYLGGTVPGYTGDRYRWMYFDDVAPETTDFMVMQIDTLEFADDYNVLLRFAAETDEPALAWWQFKVNYDGTWRPAAARWFADSTGHAPLDTTFSTTLNDTIQTRMSTFDLFADTLYYRAKFKDPSQNITEWIFDSSGPIYFEQADDTTPPDPAVFFFPQGYTDSLYLGWGYQGAPGDPVLDFSHWEIWLDVIEDAQATPDSGASYTMLKDNYTSTSYWYGIPSHTNENVDQDSSYCFFLVTVDRSDNRSRKSATLRLEPAPYDPFILTEIPRAERDSLQNQSGFVRLFYTGTTDRDVDWNIQTRYVNEPWDPAFRDSITVNDSLYSFYTTRHPWATTDQDSSIHVTWTPSDTLPNHYLLEGRHMTRGSDSTRFWAAWAQVTDSIDSTATSYDHDATASIAPIRGLWNYRLRGISVENDTGAIRLADSLVTNDATLIVSRAYIEDPLSGATYYGPRDTTYLIDYGGYPPDAPTSLAAVAGDQSADLTWTAPTDNWDLNNYTVQYIRTDQIGVGSWTTATPNASQEFYTVGPPGYPLTNAVEYTFRVYANDNSGSVSAASNTTTATPNAGGVASLDSFEITGIDSTGEYPNVGYVSMDVFATTTEGAPIEWRMDYGTSQGTLDQTVSWLPTGGEITTDSTYAYNEAALDGRGPDATLSIPHHKVYMNDLDEDELTFVIQSGGEFVWQSHDGGTSWFGRDPALASVTWDYHGTAAGTGYDVIMGAKLGNFFGIAKYIWDADSVGYFSADSVWTLAGSDQYHRGVTATNYLNDWYGVSRTYSGSPDPLLENFKVMYSMHDNRAWQVEPYLINRVNIRVAAVAFSSRYDGDLAILVNGMSGYSPNPADNWAYRYFIFDNATETVIQPDDYVIASYNNGNLGRIFDWVVIHGPVDDWLHLFVHETGISPTVIDHYWKRHDGGSIATYSWQHEEVPHDGTLTLHTDSQGDASNVVACVRGGEIYLFYQQWENANSRVFLRVWDQTTQTWGDELKVTGLDNGTHHRYPNCPTSVPSTASYIPLIYTDRSTGDVYFTKVATAGAALTDTLQATHITTIPFHNGTTVYATMYSFQSATDSLAGSDNVAVVRIPDTTDPDTTGALASISYNAADTSNIVINLNFDAGSDYWQVKHEWRSDTGNAWGGSGSYASEQTSTFTDTIVTGMGSGQLAANEVHVRYRLMDPAANEFPADPDWSTHARVYEPGGGGVDTVYYVFAKDDGVAAGPLGGVGNFDGVAPDTITFGTPAPGYTGRTELIGEVRLYTEQQAEIDCATTNFDMANQTISGAALIGTNFNCPQTDGLPLSGTEEVALYTFGCAPILAADNATVLRTWFVNTAYQNHTAGTGSYYFRAIAIRQDTLAAWTAARDTSYSGHSNDSKQASVAYSAYNGNVNPVAWAGSYGPENFSTTASIGVADSIQVNITAADKLIFQGFENVVQMWADGTYNEGGFWMDGAPGSGGSSSMRYYKHGGTVANCPYLVIQAVVPSP